MDSVYRTWVGLQFGVTLAKTEKKKVKLAFLQLPTPSFFQVRRRFVLALPVRTHPQLSISEFRREDEAGRAGENKTLELKVYSPFLWTSVPPQLRGRLLPHRLLSA